MHFDPHSNKMTPHMAMQVGMGLGGSDASGCDMSSMIKKPNTLPTWGNTMTMNLNPLIHTNIQNSPYYTGKLSELKTYHELVDEIYYKVKHLEPWEKGSRNAGGRRQTGMCGGVRGVGVGGIISSAFCILYRLFAVRLTRKQLYGLLNHGDSPYIRGIGFLYVRFSQPPTDFWEWFEPYIDDPEEVDARAGGGQIMTIGEVVRHLITRQDWFSTLFPRIPVPIQIQIDKKLAALQHATSVDPTPKPSISNFPPPEQSGGYEDQGSRSSHRDSRDSPGRGRGGGGGGHSSSSSGRRRSRSRSRSPDDRKHKRRSRSRSRSRSPDDRKHKRRRDRDDRKRSRSRSRDRSNRHRHDRR